MATNIKLKVSDIIFFTKHLSVMLKSGVPILEALEIIEDQAVGSLKNVAQDVKSQVGSGVTLEQALARHPNTFNKFYTSLVRIGESSGSLEQSLEYLAQQLEKNNSFTQKLTSSLLYPSLVLITALLVGIETTVFTLPKLTELFKSIDTPLPLPTRILMALSDWTTGYGAAVGIGLIVFLLIFSLLLRFAPFRKLVELGIVRIPVIGKLLINIHMTYICRNIGITLKNGMPIDNCFLIQAESTTNLIFKEYLYKLYHMILNGVSLSEAFKTTNFKYFPNIARKMVSIGEKSGKLDETLEYLSNFYENEVDNVAKNFSTIIEPALLMFIGFVVGFLALAIISPIYQFTGAIR